MFEKEYMFMQKQHDNNESDMPVWKENENNTLYDVEYVRGLRQYPINYGKLLYDEHGNYIGD